MGLFDWMNSKIANIRWYDISLTKLSTAAFILMIAKLWNPILILDWYWYLVIGVLAAISPIMKMLKKQEAPA